jgi:hypothetical protein
MRLDLPIFWKDRRPSSIAEPLKQASGEMIKRTIGKEYQLATKQGEKPPNIKELPARVKHRLNNLGYTASNSLIQTLGERPEFKNLRRKPGTTLKNERRTAEA